MNSLINLPACCGEDNQINFKLLKLTKSDK